MAVPWARADEFGAAGSNAYLQQTYVPHVDQNVSLSTGAVVYDYPFEVAPGTGGMAPRIGLSYNSQSGFGNAGWGWNLTGLDAIQRSTRRGVPSYQATNTDTFVWHGEELVKDANGVYHTEHESFARIQNFNGFAANSYWVVTTKDGTQYRYGYNSDSRIEALESPGQLHKDGTGALDGQVRHWALDQIKDANGNSLDIVYSEDATNGEYYPITINYTTNGTLPANRSVSLTWEARPDDSRYSYQEGAYVKTTKRLKQVDAYVGANLFKRYLLTYTKGSANKSLLSQVKTCGSDGTTCLPPTKFGYQGLNTTLTATTWSDGQSQAIRYGDSGNTLHELIDMDGDGLVDDVYKGTNNFSVRLNTGSGFSPTLITNWGTEYWDYIRDAGAYGTTTDLMDMNADGVVDRIHRADTLGATFYVGYNNGTVFSSNTAMSGMQSYRIRSNRGDDYQEIRNRTYHELIDLNGDGLPDDAWWDFYCNGYSQDHCNMEWEYLKVKLNQGTSLAPSFNWKNGSFIRYSSHDLMDVNGDGLIDRIYADGTSINKKPLQVYPNTGTGWAVGETWSGLSLSGGINSSFPCSWGNDNVACGYYQFVDINGDGLLDYVSSTNTVQLNTGTSFMAAQTWTGLGGSQKTDTSSGKNWTLATLMDIDGDGLSDWVERRISDTTYTVRLNNNKAVDLLTSITLPTGGKLSYTYKSSSQYDNRDVNGRYRLPNSRRVVSSVTHDDGLGSTSTKTVAYKGGYYEGWSATDSKLYNEFRGFREVRVTEPNGNCTITSYLQDPTYKGLVSKVERYTNCPAATDLRNLPAPTGQLQTIVNTYNVTNPATGVVFPYLQTSQATTYGTASRTTNVAYTYDAYGNVLTVTNNGDTSVSGDESRTTTEYVADTAAINAWIVNRPKHFTVEGKDPTSATPDSYVKVRESWTYYDADASGNPLAYGTLEKGNPTAVETWRNSGTLSTTCAQAGTQYCIKTTSGYDDYGNVVWTKDARTNAGNPGNVNGHTTDITFDATYRTLPIQVMNAVNHIAMTSYDDLMRPVSVTDANNQVISTYYDVLSRVIAVVKPGDSYSAGCTFNTAGCYPTVFSSYVDAVVGASGITTPAYATTKVREVSGAAGTLDSCTFVDGLGRPIQAKSEAATSAQWITRDTYYDSLGRKAASSVAYLTSAVATARDSTQKKTAYSYDDANVVRTDVVTFPDGTTVSTTTDGWSTTTTDALGRNGVASRDAYGRITQVQEKNGANTYTTAYAYHSGTGELLKITDHAGNAFTFSHDSLGQKVSQTDPDLGAWTYEYFVNGTLKSQTDAQGQVTTFNYNALNQPTTKTVKDGAGAVVNTYNFVYGTSDTAFNKGRLQYVRGYTGSSSKLFERQFTYDTRGRLTANYLRADWNGTSWSKKWKISRSYDAADRLTSKTLPGGHAEEAGEVVSFSYNGAGQLNSVIGMGTNTYLSSASYKPYGKLDTLAYGNGTTATYSYYDDATADPSAGNTTYSYRLRQLLVAKGTTNLMNLAYEHDQVGNVKKLTDSLDSTKSQSFGYDALNRLTSATGVYGSKTYAYDAIGNLTSLTTGGVAKNYFYNGTTHKLACTGAGASCGAAGMTLYTHDLNGNITGR